MDNSKTDSWERVSVEDLRGMAREASNSSEAFLMGFKDKDYNGLFVGHNSEIIPLLVSVLSAFSKTADDHVLLAIDFWVREGGQESLATLVEMLLQEPN